MKILFPRFDFIYFIWCLADIKPFASDSAKQARYEAYLRGEESRDSGVGGGGGGGGHVTEWERHREREEFARTERIFQPLASSSSSSSPSSLSSRFTRGGTIDQDRGGGGGGGGADKDAGRDEVEINAMVYAKYFVLAVSYSIRAHRNCTYALF